MAARTRKSRKKGEEGGGLMDWWMNGLLEREEGWSNLL